MSPGWADVQQGLIADAGVAALVVAELGRDPGNGAALAMAGLILDALDALAEMSRRWVIDEAVLEAERARAYTAGYEACKAERCRMQVIDGGRAGPH